MEWKNKLVFEFLKLYNNEPSLWNTASPEYKNNDKYDAWSRIKNNLKCGATSITIKELKRKRDNLMSTYRKQRTKVRVSMLSAPDRIYKPEWPFYNTMAKFLDDVYRPRKRQISEESLKTEDAEENTSVGGGDENKDEDENDEDEEDTTFQIIKTSPKKRKSNEYDEPKPMDIIKLVSPDPEETCILYCNLLCSKLKALQESTRDVAMMEIDRLMYDLKQQDKQTHAP